MNIFKDLKIGARLLLSMSFLIILLIIIAGASIWSVISINQSMDDAIGEFKKSQMAYDVNLNVDQIIIIVGNMVATGDAATINQGQAEIETHRTVYKQDMESLKTLAVTTQEKQLITDVEDSVVAMRTVNDQVISLIQTGKKEDAIALYAQKSLPGTATVNKAIQALLAERQTRLSATTQTATATVNNTRNLILIATILALILAGVLVALLVPSIIRPINESVNFLKQITSGDISKDPPQSLINRQDEMGTLAKTMLTMTEYLRTNVSEISESAESLSSSSEELLANSDEAARSAKEASMRANAVAAAAEEMSANTVSVAAGMEQATTSLSSVATAVEEMTSTIGEIAKNSERARYTTEQTAQQVNQYAGVMRSLGQASSEIGKFTETIASISAQTNLLALNATIEAARAGAAGKGFAVVANEIKELAQQTAAATGEIKNKINAIQGSTEGAVKDVEKIVQIIQEVNDSVSSTAAAIQEQATVTQDIALNIAQASSGIKDANNRIAQTATVSRSIAQDIATVSDSARMITDSSESSRAGIEDLAKLAEQLNHSAARFTA